MAAIRVRNLIGSFVRSFNHRGFRFFVFDCFCFLILPNVFLGAFSLVFEVSRPLINVDYVFVGLLYRLGFSWLGSVALLFSYSSDVLALVGQIFPVIRLSDAFYLLSFLNYAPPIYGVALLVVILVFSLLAYVFLRMPRKINFREALNNR